MDQDLINEWAKVLVGHSLTKQFSGEFKGKKILVQGEVITEPLMIALEEEITKKGGYPIIRPFFSNHHRRNLFAGLPALKYGNESQISFIPQSAYELYKEVDGFISILGTENPLLFEGYLEGLTKLKKVNSKLDNIRVNESVWVLTKYPTKADAEFEGLTYEEYCKLLINSSIIDYDLMEKEQEKLTKILTKSKNIKIRTYHHLENRICELIMDKGENLGVNCCGLINIPDGEVYTSPFANTVQGEIFLDIPIFSGKIISGVYLKFENGLIVDYSAKEGEDELRRIIESDEDSKKLGEFAIGTNYHIDRSLKEILFTEKIGGTIHLAIGCSYDDPYPSLNISDDKQKDLEREKLRKKGIYSKSVQHVDIPKDFRNSKAGEGLFLDEKELFWNGKIWEIK